MCYQIGLKLWSTNTGAYLREAQDLFNDGVYDYIELYIVPNTLHTLSLWEKQGIPYIIHNPHSMHGFNLADASKKESNRLIFQQVQQFADTLKAPYIIFHGGKDGTIEETITQLLSLHEPRALIENLPVYPLPNSPAKQCRGATLDELKLVKNEIHCGFCLDFGHAVCSANAQGKKPYYFLQELLRLEPKMFHLSDLKNIHSFYDSHLHLGKGTLDIATLKHRFLPSNARISIETEKSFPETLHDFVEDVLYFKQLCS